MFGMINRPEAFSVKEYEKFYNDLFFRVTGEYAPSWFVQDTLVMGCYMNQFFINVLATDSMQNCRGKVQTAFSYKQNPRMELCSRYDHMINAFILGLDFLMIQEKKGVDIDDKTKISFLMFLLTHDIGHGPFSHPFELMVDGYKGMHEDIGKRTILEREELVKAMDKIYPGLANDVVNFKENDKYGLVSLLEGQFDFDRAAFMLADTFQCDSGNNHTNKSIYIIKDLETSIYRIMKAITFKDGKVYYDENCFNYMQFFLKTRKENYETLYCSPDRLLYDDMLTAIGKRVIELELDKIEYSPSDRNAMFYDRIVSSVGFIRKMKEKHAGIDLDLYHSFNDDDFNSMFYLLNFIDDPVLNEYCRICSSDIEEMITDYDVIEFASEEEMLDFKTSNHDAIVSKQRVNVYKSTEDENVRFLMNDGTIIDFKDHPDRTLDINPVYRYYAFKPEKKIGFSDEEYETVFRVIENTIRGELERPENMFPNNISGLAGVVHERLMDMRAILNNGGNISDYMASTGVSLREVATTLLAGAKTKKLQICARTLLIPQSELGNSIQIVDCETEDRKKSIISQFRDIIISDEPDDVESNYRADYLANNAFLSDDSSKVLFYRPFLNKFSNYSSIARKQIEKLLPENSLPLKMKFLHKNINVA